MDYNYYGTPLLGFLDLYMVSQSGSCGRQLTCQLPRTRSLMCCTRRLKTQKAIDEAACSQIAVSEHTDGKFNGKEETWGEKRCMTVEITSTLRGL